jgi:hypothetical protein
MWQSITRHQRAVKILRRSAKYCLGAGYAFRLQSTEDLQIATVQVLKNLSFLYDKLARNYLSGVVIAATCAYWIN